MRRYNIYLRKDGRWEGRIPKQSEDGKRKYKSFFGKTREDVVNKIDEFHETQSTITGDSITFGAVFYEWFRSIQYRIKESTAANYMMKAKKHLIPEFGDSLIFTLSQDIFKFVEAKREKGLSDRYIADIISLMRSVCKFAARKYHITDPLVDIRIFKRKSAEIKILDKEEHRKLEKYVTEQHNRTNMGIALTMATGIRIGELCALKWTDIDLEKRIMTVRHTIQRIQKQNGKRKTKIVITEPKSESSKRNIPIPDSMIPYLLEFKGADDEFVLSGTKKPVEPRTMQNRFVRILNNVNLPSVHFHSLRHYFASSCIRLGFDVKSLSELLGHGSVEITLNRYVHSSMEQKREYMNRIKVAA